MNEQSSRSHCLLTLEVESKPAVGAGGGGGAEGGTGSRAGSAASGYRRFGKLTFVDLVGRLLRTSTRPTLDRRPPPELILRACMCISPEGKSCSDVARVLVLNDPPAHSPM